MNDERDISTQEKTDSNEVSSIKENTNSNDENSTKDNTISNNENSTKENTISTNSKKKKRHITLIITLSIIFSILIICACLILFVPRINNYVCLKFMSPKNYMAKVERDTIKEKTSKLKDLKALKYLSLNDKEAANISYELKISDECKKTIKSFVKEDKTSSDDANETDFLLSIIESVDTISTDTCCKKDNNEISGSLKLNLNTNETLKLNYYIDKKDSSLSVQIPTISEKWLSFVSPKKKLFSNFDMNKDFFTDDFSKIITEYSSLTFENFENVTKKEDSELCVNKNTQKCTLLEAKLTDKESKKIVLILLKKAKDDKSLYEIIKRNYSSLSFEDYQKQISEEIDEVEKSSDKNDSLLTVKSWVDNKGYVIGNEFSTDNISLILHSVEAKDNTTDYAFYIKEKDKNIVSFEGSSTNSKDSENGDFKLTFHNEENKNEEATFDLSYSDMNVSDEGIIEGNLKIECEQLFGVKIDVNYSNENSKQVSNSSIHFMGINCGTIKSSIEKTQSDKVEDIKKPTESIQIDIEKDNKDKTNDEKMNEYIDSIKLDTLANNLKSIFKNEKLSKLIDNMLKNTKEFKEALKEDANTDINTDNVPNEDELKDDNNLNKNDINDDSTLDASNIDLSDDEGLYDTDTESKHTK